MGYEKLLSNLCNFEPSKPKDDKFSSKFDGSFNDESLL